MNKLNVALKLLQLLNERKRLDTRVVADELHVSLRSAQRYLLELSALPCVTADEKQHTYSLAPDYLLKKAFHRVGPLESMLPQSLGAAARAVSLNEGFCLACSCGRTTLLELPAGSVNQCVPRETRQKLNQLLAIVRRGLHGRKRGFP